MFIQDRHFNNYNIAVINVCPVLMLAFKAENVEDPHRSSGKGGFCKQSSTHR